MRDEGVYVNGHPLLNRRCTRLPGCIHSQKRNFLNCLTDVNLLTKLQLVTARYGLIVLKMPLNPQSINQSINQSCEQQIFLSQNA